MKPLHAEDPMGEAAHAAAMLVHFLDVRLLAAASPNIGREDRAHYLSRALEQWPKLCRAMARLQETAPTVTRQAEDADGKLRDFVESRQP